MLPVPPLADESWSTHRTRTRRARELGARIDVDTCEPETATPMAASLCERRPAQVERRASFVDAIGTPEVLPEVYDALVF